MSGRSSARGSRAWRPASSKRRARWASAIRRRCGWWWCPKGFGGVLPALMNQFISLLKASSLVYFLGLVANQRELFQVGRDLNAQTGNLSPLVAAGLFYLALTVPLTHLVNVIDARLRRGRPPGEEDPLELSTSQEMI